MSKAAAIHTAVALQLAADNKVYPGLGGILGPTPPATTGGLYDTVSIRGFLANVALRLRADTPPLLFNWGALKQDNCLTDKLWVIQEAIASVTEAISDQDARKS